MKCPDQLSQNSFGIGVSAQPDVETTQIQISKIEKHLIRLEKELKYKKEKYDKALSEWGNPNNGFVSGAKRDYDAINNKISDQKKLLAEHKKIIATKTSSFLNNRIKLDKVQVLGVKIGTRFDDLEPIMGACNYFCVTARVKHSPPGGLRTQS